MGKRANSSDGKKAASGLTLADLLTLSPHIKNVDAQCEELLGEMYPAVFGTLSDGSTSKIRNGGGPQNSYENGLKYLQEHPGIRDHILGVWKQWQMYPRYSGFSTGIRAILEDAVFVSAGSPEQVQDLTEWLYRNAGAEDKHDQAELLATLTLLACTIGYWSVSAPLCVPAGSMIFSGISHGGTLSQEADILEQVRLAEERQDHRKAIRLLTELIENKLCRSRNVGEYHYRISLGWECLREKTNDPQEKRDYAAQALRSLTEACAHDHPEALLCVAKRALSERQLKVAYDHCRRIVDVAPHTQTGGEASWILYRLGKEDHVLRQWQEAAAGYLKLASQYGHPEAVMKYREENAVSLSEQLLPSRDTSTGVFCVNTDNEHARMLLATKPDSWLQGSGPMTEAPRDKLARKYFFLDDDYSRNISQALRLLQSIKNSGAERADIAIYLRAVEEQAAPLIDTALACMEDPVIPVCILDDDRLAARVLGCHPLYYPIRNLPDDVVTNLDLVVIGDSRCCEWLVREAFWMTTFRNRLIHPQITVLAPDAAGMVDRLIQHCPAMADAKKRPDQRSGDPISRDFPLIRAIKCSYGDSVFRGEMTRLLASQNVYIAVDTGGDLQNMELATFLREQSIRTAVDSRNLRADRLPVITFRCADTDIASLSRRSVVLNENSGKLWYNNYNLIPFGVVGEQYSWDALTNDLLRKLSLDIHMVYCGIDPQEDRESANWLDAWNSYYRRSYNRDSSIAVALSLGYRLYQSNYKDCGRIVPDFWDILDGGAIFSEQGLKQLSEKLGSRPQTDDTHRWVDDNGKVHHAVVEGSCRAETLALAEWEHDRWNRFMISRGWKPASIEQMRTYRAAGNQRQQLYIGRLHPCICPFDALERLEVELNKNFRNTDIENIRKTKLILTRQWTEPQRLLERSRERSDRERTR